MYLDSQRGQSDCADWQETPGGRIEPHALLVLDEPGYEGPFEGFLLIVQEHAQQALIWRQRTGGVQPSGSLLALLGIWLAQGHLRPVAGR